MIRKTLNYWSIWKRSLVDFLNSGAASRVIGRRSTSHAAHIGHATSTSGHTATGTSSHGLKDGHGNAFEFLLLLFVLFLFGSRVAIQPGDGLFDLGLQSGFVSFGNLALDFGRGDGGLERVAVVLKSILGFDTVLVGIVLGLVLLGFSNHALNLILGKTTLIVGNGNLVLLTGGLLQGRDVQDTVGIDIEANIDLGLSTRHGRNSVQVELSEQVVILGHGTFSFEDLNQDTRLVISVSREGLGLLGGNSGVTLDEGSHDTSSSLQTEGKRSDVQQQKLRKLLRLVSSRQDSSLDGSSVSDSLIGVDGLAGFLSVEEIRQQGLDLGDTGRTSNEHDLVDLALGNLGIAKDLLARVHALLEVVHAQILETGTGDGRVEIDTIKERVNLNVGLSAARKRTLGTFASSSETTKGALVAAHILAVATLEVLQEIVDHAVIKVLSTQVSISSSGLNLEDSFLNGQQGDIESTSTQVEDQNILFFSLLVQTVGNGGSGRFVNDTKNVESSNGSSVLGGLTLRVVEVSGDSDDSVLDFLAQVSFSDILHLGKNHGGDFFSLELLGFSLVFDLNDGGASGSRDDLERPVLHIGLNTRVRKLASDQTLGIEDSVGGVHGSLGLGGISNQTLSFGKGNVGRSGTVTLVIGNNFDTIILPDTYTRVGGSEIDTDRFSSDSTHDVISRNRFSNYPKLEL
mmetsp:Transcript_20197/g.58557  ORF Transcript_20197/g.58557 Transcript_20197/m.58557 type:complete len:686 (-) Transcript_20197:20-2077(-)